MTTAKPYDYGYCYYYYHRYILTAVVEYLQLLMLLQLMLLQLLLQLLLFNTMNSTMHRSRYTRIRRRTCLRSTYTNVAFVTETGSSRILYFH